MRITNSVSFLRTCAVAVAVTAAVLGQCGVARADIIDEWGTLTVPTPAPELKPAVLDPKTTALLMLDFLPPNCGRSPRCMGTLPKVKALLDAARAAKALVVYTEFPPVTMAEVLPGVAPLGNEPNVQASADKFINSNLDQTLKTAGIKTVIVVGAAANGAVLYTGSDAAQRGYKVIVPVDGMSGNTPFAEAYTALQMTTGPTVAQAVTLTRTGLVKFGTP
jgi:nicotinamidase-related amidase